MNQQLVASGLRAAKVTRDRSHIKENWRLPGHHHEWLIKILLDLYKTIIRYHELMYWCNIGVDRNLRIQNFISD